MEKTRDEIEEAYKWDLSTIYKDNNELLKDYNNILKKIEDYKKYENIFLNSAEDLYNALKDYDSIDMIIGKMWTFTSHRYDTDLSNNENQAFRDKVYNLYEKFSVVCSFITPKLLRFGYDNVKKYCDDYPKLKEYSFEFEEIFRYENHTLSENEEKLMAGLSKAMSDTGEISSMLSDSDLVFGDITDSYGKKVKLTDTNYGTYIISKNRKVRKEAFDTLYKTYKQFNNTYALLLSGEVERKKALAKVKHFNSSLEAALFGDNVSTDVYNNLIKSVNKNLYALYDYYSVKKNILGLDEMHIYDTYTPISSDDTKKYTFEEAKDLVINALSILGDDYITNLKKAFSERWIDIYPNKSKRGGAYSGGSYLTNPFVLLNFKGTYSDVSTIAHELGHSMHSYYSIKNNPYQYSGYKIFVAEVASQVNELLFNHYMFTNAISKEEKINILNQTLDLFKASIYRQTMFAEFEKDILEICEDGEILTADVLNNKYYDLVKKYFGDIVVCDDYIKYEWQRIPHFYYNFYVYKYSIGLAAAAFIANNIINNKESAKENYLAFLKTGGSMYPLDELRVAGVNLEDEKTIDDAPEMFKNYLEELKKLTR